MKHNVGSTDRVIRLVLAVMLFAVLFLVQSPVRWIGILGIIAFATGVVGTCPLYALWGLSTCPRDKK